MAKPAVTENLLSLFTCNHGHQWIAATGAYWTCPQCANQFPTQAPFLWLAVTPPATPAAAERREN